MSMAMPIGFRRAAIAGFMAALLGGCGEEPPPEQTPAPRVEMTGTITGGATAGPGEYAAEPSVRGSVGRPRTAAISSGSLQYAVSLAELAGPYALTAFAGGAQEGVRLYSVATAPGVANITPLTTLLVAQLYGQDPATVFQGFGAGGSVDVARVTPANLQEAQARVNAFIQEELGILVPVAVGDFITTAFRPAPGDAMYDSIAAITARLQALGMTPAEFTGRVAQAARLCLTERVAIAVMGNTMDFCPLNKTATGAPEDPAHFDYVYADRHGNTLTVVVDGDAVSSARYETTGETYLCAGIACGTITLGTPAANLTRTMQFGNASLQGSGGSAAINGTLTGAIPGIVLPVLPCDSNLYFVIFADRSVVGTCVNADPYGFGIGALLGNQSGVSPSRMRYDFPHVDGNDPTRPQLSVVTDANEALLAVQFIDYEPDSYTPRRIFACKLEACHGVTLGPVTENTDVLGSDPPILIRTVTLQDTELKGYDSDGNETGETAKLSASVNTAYFDFAGGSYIPPIEYPSLAPCTPPYEPVAAVAGSSALNLCLTPRGTALEQPNGDVLLVAGNYETDSLRILLRAGAVVQVSVDVLNQPLGFICNNACAGISVSQPDADGLRTLHFDNAPLHESLLDRLDGPRTLMLNGGTVVFEAQIPQP